MTGFIFAFIRWTFTPWGILTLLYFVFGWILWIGYGIARICVARSAKKFFASDGKVCLKEMRTRWIVSLAFCAVILFFSIVVFVLFVKDGGSAHIDWLLLLLVMVSPFLILMDALLGTLVVYGRRHNYDREKFIFKICSIIAVSACVVGLSASFTQAFYFEFFSGCSAAW